MHVGAVERAGFVGHQAAVEGHALQQLEAAVELGQSPRTDEQQQGQQREMKDEQRQLPAQQRMHDQRGEQVDAERGEHQAEPERGRLCEHDRAEQHQQRERAAQRAEVRGQSMQRGVLHGGFSQTSFIQSLPLFVLLPLVPNAVAEAFEPQLLSFQLPLVAKVRTFNFALR